MTARHLAFAATIAVLIPAAPVHAQFGAPPPSAYAQSAYNQGYERGRLTGEQDARRGRPFDFSVASEYRRGNYGYDSRSGTADRYRRDFQLGFEAGYRAGFQTFSSGRGRGRGYGNGNYGYGTYGTYGYGRGSSDLAIANGYRDGYEEGLNDGRKRHTNDPRDESRFRDADRGYERYYGAREIYRTNYRQAFVDGYEAGYRDGWQYR
jgi:hypothetical protein